MFQGQWGTSQTGLGGMLGDQKKGRTMRAREVQRASWRRQEVAGLQRWQKWLGREERR